MVEGGGKMLALFWPFVDVLYLTLCPRMLGDHPGEAGLPSLFTGEALPPHTQPPLKLVACQPMGDELFLTYTKPN
jgi:riboflavin biosynthesis pyrimidine reductase